MVAGGIDLVSVKAAIGHSRITTTGRYLHARPAGVICRLRWHLVTIAPELEAQLRPAALKGPRICARLARQLARRPQSPRLQIAKRLLKRISEIGRAQRELLGELTNLIDAHAPQLLAQPGCATVTAAIIIRPHRRSSAVPDRRTLRPTRRHRPDPRPRGNTHRHRRHRGGERQLNRAIHIIARSRARTDPDTHAYLARKHAEGKTKREAIRCLKRQLARRIWRLLYTTQTSAPPPMLINHSNSEIPTFT